VQALPAGGRLVLDPGFVGRRLDAVFDYGARRGQQLFTSVNDKKSRVD
jgi:hypothetical protein